MNIMKVAVVSLLFFILSSQALGFLSTLKKHNSITLQRNNVLYGKSVLETSLESFHKIIDESITTIQWQNTTKTEEFKYLLDNGRFVFFVFLE